MESYEGIYANDGVEIKQLNIDGVPGEPKVMYDPLMGVAGDYLGEVLRPETYEASNPQGPVVPGNMPNGNEPVNPQGPVVPANLPNDGEAFTPVQDEPVVPGRDMPVVPPRPQTEDKEADTDEGAVVVPESEEELGEIELPSAEQSDKPINPDDLGELGAQPVKF